MIAKLILRIIFGISLIGSLLFVAAGSFAWPGAWVFLTIFASMGLGGGAWLARADPGLFKERMAPPIQRGQKRWDQVLMSVLLIIWLGWFVLMGLDFRFGWSSVPVWAQVVGAGLLGLTAYSAFLTVRANRFAAPVVKIQKERGHIVITTGPYAYVRHPMYAGAIFYAVGAPLLLGSLYGLLVSALLILLLGLRAVLEERTLAAELEGYVDYAARVRYRFVPFVW